ncbi:MAG TPA: transposase [Acidobacteriaceae bacterium]|nr:transposase [Acidobacteriaceae bacterium]
MPTGLKRYQEAEDFHFITFSCYRREPFLGSPESRSTFETIFEETREKYAFLVLGYVVMPEHVHLLVDEPRSDPLSLALQVLKQRTSRRINRAEARQFWQSRYYDFNVWSGKKSMEKLRYMHRNPVARGLVSRPEDWAWSSFRHYATGERGTVEIESEWTVCRRQMAKLDVQI